MLMSDLPSIVSLSGSVSTRLELHGQAYPDGWRGRIEQVDVQSQRYDNWQLERPADLSIGEDSLELAPLCLLGDAGSVCMNFDWKDEKADGSKQCGLAQNARHLFRWRALKPP